MDRGVRVCARGYYSKRLDLDKSLHSIRQILTRIMHEQFCCNQGFAALGMKRERNRQDVRDR